MLFSIGLSDCHSILQRGSPKKHCQWPLFHHRLCNIKRKMYTVFNAVSSDIILFFVLGIMTSTALHSHRERSCDRRRHEVLMKRLVCKSQQQGLSKIDKNIMPHKSLLKPLILFNMSSEGKKQRVFLRKN